MCIGDYIINESISIREAGETGFKWAWYLVRL